MQNSVSLKAALFFFFLFFPVEGMTMNRNILYSIRDLLDLVEFARGGMDTVWGAVPTRSTARCAKPLT